jgi:hypothetical protein
MKKIDEALHWIMTFFQTLRNTLKLHKVVMQDLTNQS